MTKAVYKSLLPEKTLQNACLQLCASSVVDLTLAEAESNGSKLPDSQASTSAPPYTQASNSVVSTFEKLREKQSENY